MFRYLGIRWDVSIPTQAAVAQRIAESMQCAKGWRTAHSSPGLGVFTIGSRPGANDIYPLPHARGVVIGRLFRRRDGSAGVRDIDLSGVEGQRVLQTGGRALVTDYWGRYIAILRSSESAPQVLRDPSGTLPCFQKDIEGVTVLFSWLEDVIALMPHLPMPRVDWDAMAAYISLGRLGGRETALVGVSQILAGQLTVMGEQSPPPLTLWSAAAVAECPVDLEPVLAAERLRQEVMNCAHAWSSCYDSVLLRLSGGVDSAILLGCMVAQPTPQPITCLNYHSPGSDSDERRYARLAAAKAGVKLVERERDVNFCLDDVLAVNRTPTPETYIGRLGTSRIDAEVAAAYRAPAMFTGAAGDQLFFQFRCTWPAADYLSRHGLRRGFLRASLDAARLGRVSLRESMWRALVDQRHRTSVLEGRRAVPLLGES